MSPQKASAEAAASLDRQSDMLGVAKAANRSQIDSFIVMDVMRQAAVLEAAGTHVIHMEVGQPATPAPQTARDAATRAMEAGPLGYTMALGDGELRARIAAHYQSTYGIAIAPERVIVTTGSSAAFVLAFLAVFDVGCNVGLPQPGYPCYRQILTALGQTPVMLATGPETRWMPSIADVAARAEAGALQGMLLASPSNPTGTMIEPERLRAIIEIMDRHGIWFISDEIYHGLTYDAPAATALAYSDRAIVINSFSKYFSMTGWRIGWMIVPDDLVRTVERLAQNFYIAPPAISQVAALAAFDAGWELGQHIETYRRNRALLLDGLPGVGFDKLVPADGAFYLYCDVSAETTDSVAYAKRILDETGVAVTPGVDFDAANGNTFIRFSYARSTDDIREGLRRLQAWRAGQ